MATHPLSTFAPVALAAGFTTFAAPLAAVAQNASLPTITITGQRPSPNVGVSGFGDEPLGSAPFSAQVITETEMKDRGTQRLSDLTLIDASVSDGYNAAGYWDFLTVRGFVLDNRYNFRREGLPINAETSIPLDNKSRIELLKGTSGIQAGTSAPGGLVNHVVKRPTSEVRAASLAWQGSNSWLGAVDIGTRLGDGQAFGVRVNAAYEHLDPKIRDLQGHRHLLAVAGDWRLGADTAIEAEVETSRRSQPSQPGFSMLGSVVPAPGDPRINLNNQPWTLPVVFNATTATLRWQQRLTSEWRLAATVGTQRLRTDDRVAFPFGCGAEGNFDRYCSDGSFDLYDFRSENEHRRTNALDISANGKLATGALTHDVTAGALHSRYYARLQNFAFNLVGTGNVEGTAVTGPDPSTPFANTNRDERSTELYLRDAVGLTPALKGWVGARHTRIYRSSAGTDGTPGPAYSQSFTTPWLALSYEIAPGQVAYASWGQGIESAVTPSLPAYANAGQPLPALKSRQFELGAKGRWETLQWTAAYFDIDRPATTDTGTSLVIDGSVQHRGVEATLETQLGPWNFEAGVMLLKARREDSTTATLNGLRPVNVPERTFKMQARHRVDALPGLTLLAGVVHEGNRIVTPDNSARIPSWTRVDLGARHEHQAAAARLTWRIGVDNVFDKRAWRESPFQFGHIYLYPLAPRTFRVSLQADL